MCTAASIQYMHLVKQKQKTKNTHTHKKWTAIHINNKIETTQKNKTKQNKTATPKPLTPLYASQTKDHCVQIKCVDNVVTLFSKHRPSQCYQNLSVSHHNIFPWQVNKKKNKQTNPKLKL